MYTYIPSFLDLVPTPTSPIPPLYISAERRAELPALFRRFPLAVGCTHSSVYMSVQCPDSSHPLLPPGFPCGSAGKESACNAVDLDSIPGLGRSPGEGKVYPLQYSGLENSMDCIVHGVAMIWTRLSDFHFLLPLPCPRVHFLRLFQPRK